MVVKKKNIVFLVGLISVIIFSYFVLQFRVRQSLIFFWSSNYAYIIYAALILALIFIIGKKYLKNTKWLKYPYFLIFLPIAIFPALRCYFKVPYLFCRICPQQCPWGQIRNYTVPGFLILNLDKRFWCYKLCPFGTIQDYQSKICRYRVSMPNWLVNFRYLFLGFAITIVLATIFYLNSSVNSILFRGNYLWSIWALIVVIIIFTLAFFIPRFWCNYICPIGSFSDIILKIKSKIKKKWIKK